MKEYPYTYLLPDTSLEIFKNMAQKTLDRLAAEKVTGQNVYEWHGYLKELVRQGLELVNKAKPAKSESYYAKEAEVHNG